MAYLDLTRAVRGVDSLLRSRQGIEEITDDDECLLRVSVAAAKRPVALSDGLGVDAGEPVIQLHLWNEHLPALPEQGPNAAWANLVKRRMRHSLGIVAHHIDREPRLMPIRALQGSPAFPKRLGPLQLARIAEHFGFDVFELGGEGALRTLHAALDSVLVWALIWTFNPAGLRGKGLLHRRCEIWISRDKLIGRYGRRADQRSEELADGVSHHAGEIASQETI